MNNVRVGNRVFIDNVDSINHGRWGTVVATTRTNNVVVMDNDPTYTGQSFSTWETRKSSGPTTSEFPTPANDWHNEPRRG